MCDKKFTKQHRYDAHMRKHQGLKQWVCEEKDCDKAFNKYSSLRTHIAVQHYDESSGMIRPEFVCDVDGCDKTYTQKV